MAIAERESILGGVTLERNLEATMRDGTVLRADVYRPEETGTFPVLVMRTPYNKTVAQGLVFQHPAWYARHGYVVAVQDTRGRFASDGQFDPHRFEAEDSADTIQWASRLTGSNGRVATYGFSYAGAVQLLGAAERPAELVCCAPAFTADDFYDGWTYVGGALSHAFIVSWVVQQLAIADAQKQGNYPGAIAMLRQANNFPGLYWMQPLEKLPLFQEANAAPYFFDWIEHDTRDEYWQQVSVRERRDRIAVPCLHSGGWYDGFIEGTLANFVALRELAGDDRSRAQRLVVGPWTHMPWARVVGSRDFGEQADNFIDELQVAWFDYWLKGEGDILERPAVRLFVMGENRWRDADAWPPSEVRMEEWFLRSSGRASSLSGDGTLAREAPGEEAPDIYTYNPRLPVPSTGGKSASAADVAPVGAFDQRPVEARNDVLVYSTPPLEQDVEVTGTIELVLHAATDAPDTDWTAKLVDVDENGVALNLCDGIVRARFRESLEHPTPIEPNRVHEYAIRVGSTSNLFKRGHRIRLEVSSSNFPTYDTNANNGQRVGERTQLQARVATQAVFHDSDRASRLRLPVAPR